MKRVYRIEVELGDDFELGTDVINRALMSRQVGLPSSAMVSTVELKQAQPVTSPVPKISDADQRKPEVNGDRRICNATDLKALVRMDPLCGVYGEQTFDDLLDPKGTNMVTMLLPFVNVEHSRQIQVHRVEVMAKMIGTMKPLIFTLDLPVKHWNELKKP